MTSQIDISQFFVSEQDVRSAYFGTPLWMKAPNGQPSNLTEAQWLQVRTASFKKWFGDWEFNPLHASKIIDNNGEPLVCYHGTCKQFESFDPHCLSNNTGNDGHYGAGFYFSVDRGEAETYGHTIYPVFVNTPNPVYNTVNSLELIAKDFGIEKEFQSINPQWLADQISSKDSNAGKLAELFVQGYSYEDAWDALISNGGSYHSGEIDLNSVSDWFENIEGVMGGYDLNEITEHFGEIPDHVKIYGYDYPPSIIHMTNMGNCGQSFTHISKKHGFNGVWANSEIVAFEPNQIKSALSNNGQFSTDANIYS